MSNGRISPSNDFTGKVMGEVKKRPRKIGLWNLAYFAPVALAILLLSLPATQDALLHMTSKKHVAVAGAQQDVERMQAAVNELTQFEFDSEVQAIIDDQNVID